MRKLDIILYILFFGFAFGASAQQVFKQGDKFGILNSSNEIVVNATYDYIYKSSFIKQYFITVKHDSTKKKYGCITFLNTNKLDIIRPQFDTIYRHSWGLNIVKTDSLYGYLFFHSNGNHGFSEISISKIVYDDLSNSSKYQTIKSGKIGLELPNGFSLPPIYDKIYKNTLQRIIIDSITPNGYYANKSIGIYLIGIEKDGKYNYIYSSDGISYKYLFPFIYSKIDLTFLSIKKNRPVFIINKPRNPLRVFSFMDSVYYDLEDNNGNSIIYDNYRKFSFIMNSNSEQENVVIQYNDIKNKSDSIPIDWILKVDLQKSNDFLFLKTNEQFAMKNTCSSLIIKPKGTHKCYFIRDSLESSRYNLLMFNTNISKSYYYLINSDKQIIYTQYNEKIDSGYTISYSYYKKTSYYKFILEKYDYYEYYYLNNIYFSFLCFNNQKTIKKYTYTNLYFNKPILMPPDENRMILVKEYSNEYKVKAYISESYIYTKDVPKQIMDKYSPPKKQFTLNDFFKDNFDFTSYNYLGSVAIRSLSDTMNFSDDFEIGIGLGESEFDWGAFGDGEATWHHYTMPYISLEYRHGHESNTIKIPPIGINLGFNAGIGALYVIIPIGINIGGSIGYDFDEIYLKYGLGYDLFVMSAGFEGYYSISNFSNSPNYLSNSIAMYLRFHLDN